MQTHVAQLTKQRLSDFFVKEDGHVAHKNALVAGAVVTGAILGSLILAPEAAACSAQINCNNYEGQNNMCPAPPGCCWFESGDGEWYRDCCDD